MADRFSKSVVGLDSPLGDSFSFLSNDSNTFTQPTRALYVGAGGTVTVQLTGKVSNSTASFINVANGTLLPIRCQIVYANTTANNLIGLY